MEISQLHYFKTTVRCGSFTKAAEELYITQSALSRSIAALEADIGFPLFTRKRGGAILLTPEGTFFHEQVIRVLNTLESTVTTVKEMTGLDNGIINAAASEPIYIDSIVLSFIQKHPNARLTCHIMPDNQIKTNLEDGTINFALCRSPVDGPNLKWTPLYHDHLVVMMSEIHRFVGRESITLAELKDEHFILNNISPTMDNMIITLCHRAGFDPYIIYSGNSNENLSGYMTAKGFGISIIPFSSIVAHGRLAKNINIENDAAHELPICVLSDSFATSEIGIVESTAKFHSKAALAFREAIVNHFQSLPEYDIPL